MSVQSISRVASTALNGSESARGVGGGNSSVNGTIQEQKAKKKKTKDKKDDEPYHFVRRGEALVIDKLRGTVRELQAEVERLSEANQTLENAVKTRDEKLKEANERLALQKMAWITAQRSNASMPPAPTHPADDPVEDGDLRGWTRADSAARSTPTTNPSGLGNNSRPTTASAAPTRPGSAHPAANRPASAKVPQLSGAGMPWGNGSDSQQQRPAQRPLTARPAAHTGVGGATPRQPQRPNTARPKLGRTIVAPPVMGGEPPMFQKFPVGKETTGGDNEGALSFGAFAARREFEAAEAARTTKGISEQAASWESLGVLLQCAWTEVKNGTRDEPAPHFFRLAVCCSIFDRICGVVGNYSGLLLELRREMYGCLFKGFDPEAPVPDGHQEYARLLPYFGEYRRLEAERDNARRTVERVKKLSDYATRKRASRLESAYWN